MKYLIYLENCRFEVEADDADKAKQKSEETLKKLDEEGLIFDSAKVADKKSGYFVS